MGADFSKYIKPVPATFGVFSCRFNKNVLSILHAPQEAITIIENAIRDHWKHGVKRVQQPLTVIYEIVLGGSSVDSRIWKDEASMEMVCAILSGLASADYFLIMAPDIFLTMDDAELIFHKNPNEKSVDGVMAVRLMNGDQIQAVNAPSAAVQAIRSAVSSSTYQISSDKSADNKVNIKLKSGLLTKPLQPTNEENRAVLAKFIVNLFNGLNNANMKLMASARMDGEQDIWFFKEISSEKEQKSKGFGLIMLHSDDAMYSIGFPESGQKVLSKAVSTHWHKGLQKEQIKHGMTWMKLKGTPWDGGQNEKIHADRFILRMLTDMRSAGWALECATDIFEEKDDKSVFIFRTCQPTSMTHLAMQPFGHDLLFMVDTPNDVATVVHKVLRTLIGQDGVADMDTLSDGTEKYKFIGNPWHPAGADETIVSRHVILIACAALLSRGYSPSCSCDLMVDTSIKRAAGSKQTITGDVHTLVFSKKT